jgi:hypothetical protein
LLLNCEQIELIRLPTQASASLKETLLQQQSYEMTA